jgi:hypothetical protein
MDEDRIAAAASPNEEERVEKVQRGYSTNARASVPQLDACDRMDLPAGEPSGTGPGRTGRGSGRNGSSYWKSYISQPGDAHAPRAARPGGIEPGVEA